VSVGHRHFARIKVRTSGLSSFQYSSGLWLLVKVMTLGEDTIYNKEFYGLLDYTVWLGIMLSACG